MNEALSPKTHRWLSDVHDRLLRQPYVERKLQLKATQEFRAWCDGHEVDLDAYLGSGVLRFDRELIVKVQELLDSLGHLPLGESSRGKTAAQQAKQSYQEDKGSGEGPRTHRVLLNLEALGPRPGIPVSAREVCDLDWRGLNLDSFDALIMIENLDSFYAFTTHSQALATYRQPLVVYRGDTHYGGGFSQLAKAWGISGKSHLGFGDFDPRGVGIVLASGAKHMLLPPLDWLREHATRHHVPVEQFPNQDALRKHRDQLPAVHPLRGYLALLLDEQRGLRQQWFDERLEPVPLK